jgi:hypothetical protein
LEKNLHIVCLNVPYPVDYGGVFDLFYKLPALHQQGVKIHLHCFDYGKGEQPELNKYCASVKYYKRNEGYKGLSGKLPYIVASRKNELLLDELLKDEYPIFMEGIHCTYLLLDERFSRRKKFVRIHNVEYKYYKNLYKATSSPVKKFYYFLESMLLKKYEKFVAHKATAYWGVTHKDVSVYRDEFNCQTIDYLPLYLPNWKVNCKEGIGSYCLYHGNLEVEENETAAIWLLRKVFKTIEIPLVIAGKNPSHYLHNLIHKNNNACIVADPSEAVMQDMIQKAHIHILPSFNATGIKLKLLNALFNGRHCVVNKAMVEGTSLEALCHISTSASSMKNLIEQLYHQKFTEEEIDLRRHILHKEYNNEANAKQQVKWIWEDYA